MRAAVAVVVLALAACSGGGGGAAPKPDGGARTTVVAGVDGEVEVPVARTGIWALEEGTALHLLALGVVPDHVGSLVEDPGMRAVLAAGGASDPEEVDVEAIAADDPTVVLGRQHPYWEPLASQLAAVAPTAIYPDSLSWQDQLRVVAGVVGREDRAEALIGRVEARTADLAERVADAGLAGTTVSVLARYPDAVYAYDQDTVCGRILERMGLERPAAQVDDDPGDYGFAAVSDELLDEHRAEIVVGLVDEVHTGGRTVLDEPAVVEGAERAVEVAYLPWYSTGILSAWWVLHDLDAILLDEGATARPDDAIELWEDLVEGA